LPGSNASGRRVCSPRYSGPWADAAKYDASCASSGAPKRNARNGGIGSTGKAICHAYTPDGRCISLLKILLTNFCIYDCAYCVSRRSSDVPRARFSVEEIISLTLDLYRRNCIEGLFLSSGIARGEDETMADLIRVAKTLRLEHGGAEGVLVLRLPLRQRQS
jgi:predicted DNA-binding helix-hairpin-helix protein